MLKAVAYAKQNDGKLTRYPGGFWSGAGGFSYTRPYFGTSTVEGIVARGCGVYSEWKDGRAGKFPIEMTVVDFDGAPPTARPAPGDGE